MENKEINYSLRDYQKDATDNINRIFNGDEYNRYASVVLPTGGGKSFVAIEQILSFNNPDYKNKKRNGIINDSKILYVAPSNEILSQVKLHIVKNVILSIPNLEKMTVKEIDNMIKDDFQGLDFQGINNNAKDSQIVFDDFDSSEKKNAILRQLSSKQVTELVEKAFPNLKFKCYAGIKGEKEDVNDDDVKDSDFIIVDEAHRLGASKWGPRFASNLVKNKNAKVLAITATPDRTEKKSKNMLAGIAKMVYPEDTVTPDKYTAKEMYVLDGIRDGIVNSPEIIQCDSSLAESQLYIEVLDKYIKSKGEEKEKIGEVLDEMEKLIGFSPRNLSKKEQLIKKDENIGNVIAKNIKNINGKYIVFIPKNMKKNDEIEDSTEYFVSQIKQVKKHFQNVKDENGNSVKLTFSYVTSNKEIKIDKDGKPIKDQTAKIDNSQNIKDFEDASNKSGGIKILIANEMLNEGVHIDGIDGAIMYRPINSSTIYLQQTGRCISSMNPNKPLEKQSRTQIIDTTGNSLYQIRNRTGQKTSHTYNLDKIKEIQNWILENDGKIPNINKDILSDFSDKEKAAAEKEIRYAIALKRIKVRYSIYKNNIPAQNSKEISEILNIANSINLWDLDIQTRNVEPTEKQLTGNGFLELTPSQKKFIELHNQVIEKDNIVYTQNRINKLVNIVNILKMHKPDIELPQGISIKTNNEKFPEIKSSNTKELQLDELLKNNFSQSEIERILVELQDYELTGANSSREIYNLGEKYDIGQEIAFVRGKIWTSEHDYTKFGKSYFESYTLAQMINLGIIKDGRQDLKVLDEMNGEYSKLQKTIKTSHNIENFIDEHGRLKHDFNTLKQLNVGLIEEFEECSLIDGEKYCDGFDRDGYDEKGRDRLGYNRFRFNEDNINEKTNTKYDERGFYYSEDQGKWLNRYTNTEYDLLGYNIQNINEDGFERPIGPIKDSKGRIHMKIPKCHKKNEDGTYSVHGYFMRPKDEEKKDDKSCDAHGFTGINRNNTNYRKYDSKSETNPEGFYSDGSTRKVGTGKKASPLQIEDFYINGKDIDGFNIYGYKEIIVDGEKKYINRETSSEFDKRGKIFDERTGNPKTHRAIKNSRQIIALLLGANKSFKDICNMYAKELGTTPDTLEKHIKQSLDEAFEIYGTTSPMAFDKAETGDEKFEFKGLEEYYFPNSNSTEKKERLEEFFRICPKAKMILKQEAKENQKKLEFLNKKDDKFKEKKGIEEISNKKQKQYDQIEFNEER